MNITITFSSEIVCRVTTDRGTYMRSVLNGDPRYYNSVVWHRLAGTVNGVEVWAATKTHSEAIDLEVAYQIKWRGQDQDGDKAI